MKTSNLDCPHHRLPNTHHTKTLADKARHRSPSPMTIPAGQAIVRGWVSDQLAQLPHLALTQRTPATRLVSGRCHITPRLHVAAPERHRLLGDTQQPGHGRARHTSRQHVTGLVPALGALGQGQRRIGFDAWHLASVIPESRGRPWDLCLFWQQSSEKYVSKKAQPVSILGDHHRRDKHHCEQFFRAPNSRVFTCRTGG